MIATLSRLLALLTAPLLYAFARAGWSALKRARRPDVVDRQAADLVVEVDELLGGDLSLLERLEPVLDPDVVERQAGEAVTQLLLGGVQKRRGPQAEHVDHVVRKRAAHAAGFVWAL